MKRREFLGVLGGTAIAWPLAARAQPMRRVGILMNGAATEAGPQSYVAAFVQAFRQLGWIEGQKSAGTRAMWRWQKSTRRN